MEYQEKITLKFDGQRHQVDLTVYTSVLMNYMSIVSTVAKEQNADIKLLVDATEEGSLDAIIAVTTASSGIFDLLKDNSALVQTVTSVIACTTGIEGRMEAYTLDDLHRVGKGLTANLSGQ